MVDVLERPLAAPKGAASDNTAAGQPTVVVLSTAASTGFPQIPRRGLNLPALPSLTACLHLPGAASPQ